MPISARTLSALSSSSIVTTGCIGSEYLVPELVGVAPKDWANPLADNGTMRNERNNGIALDATDCDGLKFVFIFFGVKRPLFLSCLRIHIMAEIPHMGQENADDDVCKSPYVISSASSSEKGEAK